MAMTTRSCSRGFSLIELMVVVAIIGILASIAYPSYMEYVRRSNRSEAQAILMENAQVFERAFTANGSYASASLTTNQSPKTGTAKYTISATQTASTFTLQAAPTGGYSDPTCGTLTLNQVGTVTSGGTLSACWKN